jgi:hypothetical protein
MSGKVGEEIGDLRSSNLTLGKVLQSLKFLEILS